MIEAAIRERAARAISEGVFPGCAVGAVHLDGRRLAVACGALSYEADAELVSPQTVYDLASVTKAVVTASLASILIREGLIDLTARVIDYLPELKNDHGATIEDLLRYRVRGLRLSTIHNRTFEEVRARVLEHGFDTPPSGSDYTNLPALLLGFVIERAAGHSLAAVSEQRIFGPLAMKATTYFPTVSDCAPTEISKFDQLDKRMISELPAHDRGEMRGLPHDESAYKFAIARRSAGHAGLFSTVPDLLNYCHMLLSGQFSPIVRDAENGLGWQTSEDFLGSFSSPGSFGKTGFTGTSICIDQAKGIALVILSNRTYPKRPVDGKLINAFRSDIADIVFAQ